MIKDIEFLKVEGLAIAIRPEQDDDGIEIFGAFLINFREEDLENIMIRSKGIGVKDEEVVSTSVLRTLVQRLDSNDFVKIDAFAAEAASLSNEYWISFRYKEYLYDKKFVFVPESLVEDNYIDLPLMGGKGVMIR